MEANASVLRLTLSRDGDDWKAMKSIIGSIKSEENKNEPPISGPNPLSDLVILPGVSLPIVAGVWVEIEAHWRKQLGSGSSVCTSKAKWCTAAEITYWEPFEKEAELLLIQE